MFDHDPFVVPPHLLPEKNARARLRKDAKGNFIYKKQYHKDTIPGIEILLDEGIILDCHQAECFFY